MRFWIDIGVLIALNLAGFGVTWGKMTQRLDDHIKLVSDWQKEIRNWQVDHAENAKARAETVLKLTAMFERQLEINENLKENIRILRAKVWP